MAEIYFGKYASNDGRYTFPTPSQAGVSMILTATYTFATSASYLAATTTFIALYKVPPGWKVIDAEVFNSAIGDSTTSASAAFDLVAIEAPQSASLHNAYGGTYPVGYILTMASADFAGAASYYHAIKSTKGRSWQISNLQTTQWASPIAATTAGNNQGEAYHALLGASPIFYDTRATDMYIGFQNKCATACIITTATAALGKAMLGARVTFVAAEGQPGVQHKG